MAKEVQLGGTAYAARRTDKINRWKEKAHRLRGSAFGRGSAAPAG
jgi:hypothetical protein